MDTADTMLDYYRQRAAYYERVYLKPHRQVVSSVDDHGYQSRTLDDGSTHEVLKNFPDEAELRARLAGRASAIEWIEGPHYWACRYELI